MNQSEDKNRQPVSLGNSPNHSNEDTPVPRDQLLDATYESMTFSYGIYKNDPIDPKSKSQD